MRPPVGPLDHAGVTVFSGNRDGYSGPMNDPTKAVNGGGGLDAKRILVGILVVIFLVVVLANWQDVKLNLILFDLTLPMIVWLVVAALIGALAAIVVPAVRRR